MNLTKTLSLGTELGQLYRPLVRNLIVIVVTTALIAGAALMYFDHRLVSSLSERLIARSAQATTEKLQRLFNAASGAIRVAQAQVAGVDSEGEAGRERLFRQLRPFLTGYEFLDSINLADAAGSEFVLIRRSGETLTRYVDAAAPGTAHWRRRVDDRVIEQWDRQTTASPHDRPWYQHAVKLQPGSRFWTPPYSFLTTKEPGVSVSTPLPDKDSSTGRVIAFNISLAEISHHTTRLRPSEHGMTVVFDNEGSAIGLPPDPRFEDDKALLSAVLSPLNALGIPVLDAAVSEWEDRGKTEAIFPYRTKQGASWWAGFYAIELDKEQSVWSAVLIPEDDFLGSLARLRNLALAGIGIVGLLAAGGVLAMSMRSIRRRMHATVDQIERRLGQYHLKQKIGEGGNGAVYRAQHALLRRPTAIKLMSPAFARSEAARERFEHEVQITSGLSHPNTIAIYDYGQTPDGTLYYAMELLNGSTLEQIVRASGPMPAGRVIHILQQMAGSLSEAHAKGLIHRDVKPSNAILCERGGLYDVVKVLDFGLVKEIVETDGNLTQANMLIGTPLYMAPETISRSGRGSAQSDLYAVGAVGYFLLTARNVFEGGSAVEICAKHLNDAPTPPSVRTGQDIPEDLEAVVLACLEKDPARRPSSGAALQSALSGCRDAGTWSQTDARTWWQTHAAALDADGSPGQSAPLSNTELLIDLDERALASSVS